MKNIDTAQLAKTIFEELARLFDNIKIVDVVVKSDRDRDGDDIVRIEVVFTGELKTSDAKKVAGATRQIRPALKEIDEDLYPVLSFVSKVDYERGHKSDTSGFD